MFDADEAFSAEPSVPVGVTSLEFSTSPELAKDVVDFIRRTADGQPGVMHARQTDESRLTSLPSEEVPFKAAILELLSKKKNSKP